MEFKGSVDPEVQGEERPSSEGWRTLATEGAEEMTARAAVIDLCRDDRSLTVEQAWLMPIFLTFTSSVLALLGLILALFVIERFAVSPQLWEIIGSTASWEEIRRLSTLGVAVVFIVLTVGLSEIFLGTFRRFVGRVFVRPGGGEGAELLYQCLTRVMPNTAHGASLRLQTREEGRAWRLEAPLRQSGRCVLQFEGEVLKARFESPTGILARNLMFHGVSSTIESGANWVAVALKPRRLRRQGRRAALLAGALGQVLASLRLASVSGGVSKESAVSGGQVVLKACAALPPEPLVERAVARLGGEAADAEHPNAAMAWLTVWSRQIGYWIGGALAASVWVSVIQRTFTSGEVLTVPFGLFGAVILALMFAHRHPVLPRLVPRRPRSEGTPRLILRGDLLGMGSMEEALDLSRPFVADLSRGGGLLNVVLHQRDAALGGLGRRLTFTVPEAEGAVALPVLETSAPSVSAASFVGWVWPVVRHRAASHGASLPVVEVEAGR